jgi:hypothetical protein
VVGNQVVEGEALTIGREMQMTSRSVYFFCMTDEQQHGAEQSFPRMSASAQPGCWRCHLGSLNALYEPIYFAAPWTLLPSWAIRPLS